MAALSNPKHELFAQALAKGRPASTAYVEAGYAFNEGNASRLNGNEKVQARVAELMAAGARRAEITVERTLRELAKIGFSDLTQVLSWGSREVAAGDPDDENCDPTELAMAPFVVPVNSSDLPEEVRGAVAEVSLGRTGFRIKMHDKAAALTQIGRHLGMFEDKLKIGLDEDAAEALQAARKRVEGGA